MLAGSVQVSTGTKTSLSFQDGPVFTRVHRREGPAAPRGSRARTHGTTISQPTWPGVPDRLHPAHGAGAPGQQPFEILEDLVGYVATELNANPRDLDLYARRQPTLSAHLERVREHLGLTAFDEKARQRLAPFVFKEAFRLEQGAALVSRCGECPGQGYRRWVEALFDVAERRSPEEQQALERLTSWMGAHMRSIRLPDLLIEVDNELDWSRRSRAARPPRLSHSSVW